MNKKEYKMPQIIVMTVAVENHLCGGSPNLSSPINGLDGEFENGGNNPGEFSRGYDDWD